MTFWDSKIRWDENSGCGYSNGFELIYKKQKQKQKKHTPKQNQKMIYTIFKLEFQIINIGQGYSIR